MFVDATTGACGYFRPPSLLIGSGNASAFAGTNRTGELITSGFPVIHPESARRDFARMYW